MAQRSWREAHPDLDPYGYWDALAEEFVPDGTNGPTFVDDAGTDGTQQFNVIRFLGAARTHVYYSKFLPEDYYPNGEIIASVFWRTDSTMVPTTAGTVVTWTGAVQYTTPGSHMPTATSSAVTTGTGIDQAGTAITAVNWMNDNYSGAVALGDVLLTSDLVLTPSGESPQPGDLMQFKLERAEDLAQLNDNHVEMVGVRFKYLKGVKL